MNKIENISFLEPFRILCEFKNGEKRILDLEKLLDKSRKYSIRIFNDDVYQNAKVGSFGEIYWDGIAEMKDLKGNIVPCQYDICPDYVYMHSVPA